MGLFSVPWIGLLWGMFLVVSCYHLPAESNLDTSAPLPMRNYFAEGGGLTADRTILKRKVNARKSALSGIADSSPLVGSLELKASNTSVQETRQQVNSSSTNGPNLNSSLSLNTSEVPPRKTFGDIGSLNTMLSSTKSNVTTPFVNVTSTPTPRKKGKPGLTFDEDLLPRDKNGKVIVTKEDLVSAGPSFDYVVPISIAILAVPLVAVLGTFLYKKGRDFWDRRHYRRMDFLIDGMYNDS